jgi:putative component of membrane protein insertase Oxa1/YidC/SpoIIIJ protein YidD
MLVVLSGCGAKQGGLVQQYQKSITHVLGPSCPCYPTCSEYFKVAVGKYGALEGGFLFSRRLISEKDHFRRTSILIQINNKQRYYDPVP